MEYLKDFDFSLNYHPGKANVVADALSRKALYASELLMHQCGLYEKFRDMNLNVKYWSKGVRINRMELSCELRSMIAQAQEYDSDLQKRKSNHYKKIEPLRRSKLQFATVETVAIRQLRRFLNR